VYSIDLYQYYLLQMLLLFITINIVPGLYHLCHEKGGSRVKRVDFSSLPLFADTYAFVALASWILSQICFSIFFMRALSSASLVFVASLP
jgi:hypothetical protein